MTSKKELKRKIKELQAIIREQDATITKIKFGTFVVNSWGDEAIDQISTTLLCKAKPDMPCSNRTTSGECSAPKGGN